MGHNRLSSIAIMNIEHVESVKLESELGLDSLMKNLMEKKKTIATEVIPCDASDLD